MSSKRFTVSAKREIILLEMKIQQDKNYTTLTRKKSADIAYRASKSGN